VIQNTPHPYWNLCSYHLHNACEASANSMDAWAIALCVAVEGIANLSTVELPEEKLKQLGALRAFILAQVSSNDAHRVHIDRIVGIMAGLTNVRAIDKLRRLAEEGKVNRCSHRSVAEIKKPAGTPCPLRGC
jgi:hypothetical protein